MADPTARDGEIIRLRNRTRALEAHGAELLARAERAEATVSPERVDRALRVVLADLDYDLHKALERDEETGEDTYHETVAAFMAAYGEATAPASHNCGDPNCWLEAESTAALDAPHGPADAPTPVTAERTDR